MKVRYDFVTNSSSTSFVIITDGEFNFKTFIEAIGIKDDSEFIFIYKELFESFRYSMSPAKELYSKFQHEYSSYEEFIKKYVRNGEQLLPKILLEESKGKIVYIGTLRSDNGDIEAFFCTDDFIIDTPKLYVDASDDSW